MLAEMEFQAGPRDGHVQGRAGLVTVLERHREAQEIAVELPGLRHVEDAQDRTRPMEGDAVRPVVVEEARGGFPVAQAERSRDEFEAVGVREVDPAARQGGSQSPGHRLRLVAGRWVACRHGRLLRRRRVIGARIADPSPG
jgi:hypothetical protein